MYLSIIMLAISANLDNLAVGVAFGLKKLKISIISNIIIASISFCGTYFSMYLGKLSQLLVSGNTSTIIGSILLILIGIWSIFTSVKDRKKDISIQSESNIEILSYNTLMENPDKADLNKSGYIDFKEALIIGTTLTINNIGAGFGAGIASVNIMLTSILTFIFSLIAFKSGHLLGFKYLSKFGGNWAGIASGAIIIILGLYELL